MLAKLLGFTPDLPSDTPGALVAVRNLIPGEKGMRSAPSLVSANLPALAAPAAGGVVAVNLDNTKRMIVGTAAALYEQSGGAWVDRSKVGGYTGGAESRWRFTQFGNATLAANGADKIQQSVLTGAFADIASAPKARIIETVRGFVMALATNDGTYGDRPDGWWCSALYDQTSWAPSIATQAANGRLIDTPGEITGAKALGDDIVVYKDRSMYMGRYQGPPIIWSFLPVPGEIGAPCQEAIVSIGTAHIFVGYDNIYLFDGTRPQPIGEPVRNWFFKDINSTYRYKIIGSHDVANGLVYWYYPSNSSGDGTIDSALVYNYRKDKWGHISRTIQCAVNYISGQISYDTLGSLYATYADLPTISYDSPVWLASKALLAVVDANKTVQTVYGVGENSSFTTGDFGDDWRYSTITGMRMRCVTEPATAALSAYGHATQGAALSVGPTATYGDGKFDLLNSARWHRMKVDMTGDAEVVGYDPSLSPDGER
ncbi:conserved hypothetical protein [Cupriavidus taiwanensis]|uniref:hypothetical protein n=1 Tax=Cupriavidus taiwanensis TaxID=164546 RepID=UPI000E165903|nr:hypothetical protein [Cupriavidus taiwanensis]SPA24580.1 conserved hypothetical protein [Cupriavidus taiwanensis]